MICNWGPNQHAIQTAHGSSTEPCAVLFGDAPQLHAPRTPRSNSPGGAENPPFSPDDAVHPLPQSSSLSRLLRSPAYSSRDDLTARTSTTPSASPNVSRHRPGQTNRAKPVDCLALRRPKKRTPGVFQRQRSTDRHAGPCSNDNSVVVEALTIEDTACQPTLHHHAGVVRGQVGLPPPLNLAMYPHLCRGSRRRLPTATTLLFIALLSTLTGSVGRVGR